MGEQLSQLLEDAIEERVNDDDTEEETRDDVIGLMTEGSGVTESTIRNIINGDIDCPPRPRIDPLAADLPITDEDVTNALEADGCELEQSVDKRLSYDRLAKRVERETDPNA